MTMLTVNLRWQGGRLFEAVNEDAVRIQIDAPCSCRRLRQAFPAYRSAACRGGNLYRYGCCEILRKMHLDVRELEIEVSGEQAEDFPKYFRRIIIRYLVRGRNLDRAKVERAVELSQTKYCSVRASLSDKCLVSTEISIEETPD